MGSSATQKLPEIAALHGGAFPGTMPHAMNWVGLRAGAKPARITREGVEHAKQDIGRCSDRRRHRRTDRGAGAERITVGVVRGSSVVVTETDAIGILPDQRPAFREYVVRERVPTYTVPNRVVVGGVLPEAGITYYDVPQTYGRHAPIATPS